MNSLSFGGYPSDRPGSWRRGVTLALLASACLVGVGAQAQGQSQERPIQIIVPYGTGTGTDALGRILSKVITMQTGQLVVVENKPGASAQIGAQFVARSPADGKTVLLAGDQVMCFNPVLFKSLPYHPTRDFTPIAGMTVHPYVLAVPTSLNVRTVAELVALGKAKPGSLSFASTGTATSAHLVGELFKSEAKIEMTHVPYQSGAQLFPDLIEGRVSMIFYPYQQLKPHLDSGKLRALATTTERRTTWLRDVPAMPELGFPKTQLAAYLNVYAPAGMPPAQAARLSEMFKKALEAPDIANVYPPTGVDLRYRNPAELAAFDAALLDACREVVRISGAKLE
jgi:tripartite-type tricarboxylate transporter receptor subunit TctC